MFSFGAEMAFLFVVRAHSGGGSDADPVVAVIAVAIVVVLLLLRAVGVLGPDPNKWYGK